MEIKNLFAKIRGAKIAVIGDFCVDAYYVLDENTGEISVETGLKTRSVKQMRFEPGGASNVAKNLKAIGVGSVSVFGQRGDDIYGRELERLFLNLGINCSGLIIQNENWDTNTYSKLYSEFSEEPRIDIGNFNIPEGKTARKVLDAFEKAVPQMDVIIVNQQLTASINTKKFRKRIKEIINANPDKTFIVDSRAYSDEFNGAIRKINLSEAAKVLGQVKADESDDKSAKLIAEKLFERWGQTVFITRGGNGLAVKDKKGFYLIPGIFRAGTPDTVGAGDALIAGVAACLGAGIDAYEAGMFGNACAAVTVTQRFTAGTPYPDEVAKIAADPDYIYNRELAEDLRQAKRFKDTSIEIIRKIKGAFPKHFVFDHDGTISTLRQGWEEDMQAVMIESIAGKALSTLTHTTYELIVAEVKKLIDSTTGIRTIEQMKSLVNLIRHFGIVPVSDMLDAATYKKTYLDRLNQAISNRIRGVASGIFAPEDFTIKGAISFIRELRKRGATLYLASGTDEVFVKKEAKMLGYSEVFNGGIFGAVDTADEDPKKMVMKSILDKISKSGSEKSIAVFGDGPVELREARKIGALAVGIASDEIRRYGFNNMKRSRLVLAGADVIIPDYSDIKAIFAALNWRY
jgi:rfaE bifunctional protein kinase chain/domain